MKRLAALFVILLAIPASAVEINGELEKALFEKLSSDPSGSGEVEGRVYYNTSTKKPKYYNGSNWTEVGSGAGGGSGTNYISDTPDAETGGTGSWETYADAAGTEPADGTGGTANVTLTAQSSTVGEGTYSFKFSKDAADRQGEGAAYDLDAISAIDRATLLECTLSANTTANYDTGDAAICALNDSTNEVIHCEDLAAQTSSDAWPSQSLKWAVDDTSNSDYRFALHVADSGTDAWDIYFDEVRCGSRSVNTSVDKQAWKTFTPELSINSGSTPPTLPDSYTLSGSYRKDADSMDIRVSYRHSDATGSSAGSGGGGYCWKIPGGYKVDQDYMDVTGYSSQHALGTVSIKTGTTYRHGMVFPIDDDCLGMQIEDVFVDPSNYAIDSSSSVRYTIQVDDLPISEWAGQGTVDVLSDEIIYANARANYTLNSAQSISDSTISTVKFDTEVYDSASGYSTSTGAYTCPAAGRYAISATVRWASGISSATTNNIYVYKNGSQKLLKGLDSSNRTLSIDGIFECESGDYLEVKVYQDTGGSLNIGGSATASQIFIERQSDRTAGSAVGSPLATAEVPGLVKKNRWAKKHLTSAISTTDTDVSDLSFSNLETGSVYRLTFNGYVILSSNEAQEEVFVEISNGGTGVIDWDCRHDESPDRTVCMNGTSTIFEASATSITTSVTVTGTSSSLEAGSVRTFLILEELRNYGSETTDYD